MLWAQISYIPEIIPPINVLPHPFSLNGAFTGGIDKKVLPHYGAFDKGIDRQSFLQVGYV